MVTTEFLTYLKPPKAKGKEKENEMEWVEKAVPKHRIYLDYITSVGPVTHKDFSKYKKKFPHPSLILKISFLTAGVTKKGKELIKNLDK